MEIVDQLTGGVVHDLDNILTIITGTVEILAEAVADRPKLAAIAKLIDEAATRGSATPGAGHRSKSFCPEAWTPLARGRRQVRTSKEAPRQS